MSLRERVEPGVSRRKDFPLISRKAALLIIDVQQYLMPIITTSSSGEETEEERQERLYYSEQALPAMIQNIQKLAAAFRVIRDDPEAAAQNRQKSTGCEVIFTYLQALTNDARDISLDYKLSGPALCSIPNATTPMDTIFLEELQPDPHKGKGDIMIPKTSCSVFQSTNLEYVLRNLNIEQLVIAGQLTDQCVESAVRDAADLGFLVTLAEDACAAKTLDAHLKGLHGTKGFCRILQTIEVMDEILEDLMKEQQAEDVNNDDETNGELTEAQVLAYLKERGMSKSADQLERQFNKKKASEIVRENIQYKAADHENKIAHTEQAVKLVSKNLKQKACKQKESSNSTYNGDERDVKEMKVSKSEDDPLASEYGSEKVQKGRDSSSVHCEQETQTKGEKDPAEKDNEGNDRDNVDNKDTEEKVVVTEGEETDDPSTGTAESTSEEKDSKRKSRKHKRSDKKKEDREAHVAAEVSNEGTAQKTGDTKLSETSKNKTRKHKEDKKKKSKGKADQIAAESASKDDDDRQPAEDAKPKIREHNETEHVDKEKQPEGNDTGNASDQKARPTDDNAPAESATRSTGEQNDDEHVYKNPEEKPANDENDHAAVDKVSAEQVKHGDDSKNDQASLSPHSSSSTKATEQTAEEILSMLTSVSSPPPFPLGQQVVLTEAAIEQKAQELASTLLSPPPSPPAGAGPLGQHALPIVQDSSSRPKRVTRTRSQSSLGSMAKSLLYASSDGEDSSISGSSSVDELDPVIFVDSNHSSSENLLDTGSNHTHCSHHSREYYIRNDDDDDSSFDSFASEPEEDMVHEDSSLSQDRGRSRVNMKIEPGAAGSASSTEAISNTNRVGAENASAETAVVDTNNPILKAAFLMSGRCRSRSPGATSSLSPERETNSVRPTSTCDTPNDTNTDHSIKAAIAEAAVVEKAIEDAIAEATADTKAELATAKSLVDEATPSAHTVMEDKDTTESMCSRPKNKSNGPTDSGLAAAATTALQAHISTIAISTVSKVVNAAASVAGVATNPGCASAAPSASQEKNDTAVTRLI